jgi:hypothetical protein
VSLTISPLKDTTGKVVGVSKIARDITERKRSEGAALLLGAIVDFIRRCHYQQGPRWHHHELE